MTAAPEAGPLTDPAGVYRHQEAAVLLQALTDAAGRAAGIDGTQLVQTWLAGTDWTKAEAILEKHASPAAASLADLRAQPWNHREIVRLAAVNAWGYDKHTSTPGPARRLRVLLTNRSSLFSLPLPTGPPLVKKTVRRSFAVVESLLTSKLPAVPRPGAAGAAPPFSPPAPDRSITCREGELVTRDYVPYGGQPDLDAYLRDVCFFGDHPGDSGRFVIAVWRADGAGQRENNSYFDPWVIGPWTNSRRVEGEAEMLRVRIAEFRSSNPEAWNAERDIVVHVSQLSRQAFAGNPGWLLELLHGAAG